MCSWFNYIVSLCIVLNKLLTLADAFYYISQSLLINCLSNSPVGVRFYGGTILAVTVSRVMWEVVTGLG